MLEDAVMGIYALSIVLRDSEHRSATAAVMVTLQDLQDIQEDGDSRVFVLGGNDGSSLLNDVWFSVDSKNWVQETDDADWSRRDEYQALSHNGRLYVLGGSGTYYSEQLNDVWSSADGKNWALETGGAEWAGREGHEALSHNGRLYVLGRGVCCGRGIPLHNW